jgi:hypothetical protein
VRIGIDLDGVCYQWTKTARYMLREILPNSPYKHGPLQTECTRWEYIRDHIKPEHNRWLWKEGVALGLFRHGHLFPGTIKALRQLDRIGDLVAITQRPTSAIEDTMAWIAFHRLPFREVHVLQGQSKTSVRPCEIYIDDKPENCEELALMPHAPGVAMPSRPWNIDQQPERTQRVQSWDEFVTLARSLRDAPTD